MVNNPDEMQRPRRFLIATRASDNGSTCFLSSVILRHAFRKSRKPAQLVSGFISSLEQRNQTQSIAKGCQKKW